MKTSEFLEILQNEQICESDLPQMLVDELLRTKKKIATAESCTGGMLSAAITSVSGASGAFDCGVCSYANFIKSKLVGVKEDTLATYGAVSEKTAMEMARGVRLLSGADIGVSTTGIAGPLGGTPYKPVGLKNLITQLVNSAARCGEDAVVEAIRSSMACNYQGIVFPKGQDGKRQPSGGARTGGGSFMDMYMEEMRK